MPTKKQTSLTLLMTRILREFYFDAIAAQFTRSQVHLKVTKANHAYRMVRH